MKHIKNLLEDKIFKFSEFEPTKYNGNKLIILIMEWLRAKRLNNDLESVKVSLEDFFKESGVNKDIFYTFYNEMDKTQKVKNFSIEIIGNDIIFSDFKNNEDNE